MSFNLCYYINVKEKIKGFFTDIKKNIIKNKVLLVVFIAIWIVVAIFSVNSYKSSLGKEFEGNENYENVCELNENNTVKEILPLKENVDSLCIKFATYARNNSGNVFVKIEGKESKIVYLDSKINVSFIQDNAYRVFDLKDISDKDSELIITLTSDSKPGKGVAVYYSNLSAFEGSTLEINGEELDDGDISLKYLLSNEELENFANKLVTWVIIGISVAILVLILFDNKYEIIFAILITIFGLIIMIAITPMSAPDEQLHYENCLQLSNYVLGEDHTMLDEALVDTDSFGGHYNTGYAYQRFIRDFDKPLELTNQYKEDLFMDVEGSYFVYYIPQTIGITIARLLNLNMLKTFYSGRLFNLIFYVICIFIAIKNTPIHKQLFGILAALPIFIQQACSYSYDGFILGLCFITISFFFKWYVKEEQISIKDIVLLFIVNIVLAPAKIVYSFFAFLFILIPTERFGSKKKKILTILILIAPAIATIVYNIYIRTIDQIENFFDALFYPVEAETIDVEVQKEGKMYDVSYTLSHLGDAITLVFKTIRYNIKKWFYNSIGHTLSGDSLVLPLWMTYITLVIIFASSLIKEETIVSFKVKAVLLGICVLVAFATIGGMLLGWTERDAEFVQGLQGRYFCPLLPFFFPIINNRKVALSKKISKYVIFAYILLFFEVIMYVLSYTFVN